MVVAVLAAAAGASLSPPPPTIATTLSSCSTTAYTISWITLHLSVANLSSRAALGSSSTPAFPRLERSTCYRKPTWQL